MILDQHPVPQQHWRRPCVIFSDSVRSNLPVCLRRRAEDSQFAFVDQCGDDPRRRKEHDVVPRARRACPENLAGFRIEAEQSPAVVMREAIKKTVVDDSRTHVERHLLLMPLIRDIPFPIFPFWANTEDAAVFATQQDTAVVNRRCGHVLVGPDVGKRKLPKELARSAFHSYQRPVIPFDHLPDTIDFREQWRRVRRSILALLPNLLASSCIQCYEGACVVRSKVYDHVGAIDNRRGRRAPVGMTLFKIRVVIALPQPLAG